MPVKKSTDEHRVKVHCEKSYRRVRLSAHFHNGVAIEPQATPDTRDPFDTLHNKESTWTPPEGKFTAIDYYVNRCHRAVNALDFKTTTHQNNLSPSEKQALLHLTKRNDIIIRPADKEGAVIVCSRPLCDAEAYRQLSDTFPRLLGNTRKQHPTNHCLQETNTH